jgi:hypothetical protein
LLLHFEHLATADLFKLFIIAHWNVHQVLVRVVACSLGRRGLAHDLVGDLVDQRVPGSGQLPSD